MSDGKGKKMEAALFLEGRSVPFTSINCTFALGRPATATLNMVPLRELNKILPRTLCHVFVRDNSYPGVVKPWVLLFEGEIYGIGGSKTPDNRSTVLHAMDFSNYWDNAKQLYVNLRSGSNGAGIITSTENRNAAKVEHAEVIETSTSTKAYLTSRMYEKIKGGGDFLDGVKYAIDGIKDVNSFFRYGDARVRLEERMVFSSSGKIKELFDFENKSTLIEAIIGRGNGGLVTVRTVINSLLGMIFHEFCTVPAPSKVKSKTVDERFKSNSNVEADVENKGLGEKNEKTIGSFILKPESFMLPPPKCNVLFPDMYSSLNYNRIFFNEVTRTKFQGYIPVYMKSNDELAKALQVVKYSPSGIHKFVSGETSSTAEEDKTLDRNEAFSGPDGQGRKGDNVEGELQSSNTLEDFHYQSYEEILKGIFGDQGNTMPSAQAVQGSTKFADQKKYAQKVSDFLFHKKRLAARSASTNGPLNIAPVVGFPMLILDNSAAEQHIIGKLTSVTHTLNAGGGGLSTYNLNYVRQTEEIDFWSGKAYEPPIEPWYDEETFGKARKVNDTDYKHLHEGQKGYIAEMGTINDFGNSKIKDFYHGLLGETNAKGYLGSDPITSTRYPNVASAALGLANEYNAARRAGATSEFISLHTRRDYVTLKDNFMFLGATFKNKNTDPTFWKEADLIFKGDIFDGGFTDIAVGANSRDKNLEDLFGSKATEKRRDPIDKYRARLKKERGFRG